MILFLSQIDLPPLSMTNATSNCVASRLHIIASPSSSRKADSRTKIVAGDRHELGNISGIYWLLPPLHGYGVENIEARREKNSERWISMTM